MAEREGLGSRNFSARAYTHQKCRAKLFTVLCTIFLHSDENVKDNAAYYTVVSLTLEGGGAAGQK